MIRDMLRALVDAAHSLLHPKMLAIVLWPMVLALTLWGVLAGLFWDSWIGLLEGWLQPAQDFLSRHDFVWLASVMTVVFLILLVAPLALTTALFIAAVFAMPMMVRHVAGRDFPDLQQRHGGTLVGSVWNALVAIGVFCGLWLLTLPFWLLAGLGVLFSLLLTAYLNQRLFRYDALADHASPEEFEQILAQSGGQLYMLGLLLALLHYVPVLNLLSPIYTGLVYIHFGLGQLKRLRA